MIFFQDGTIASSTNAMEQPSALRYNQPTGRCLDCFSSSSFLFEMTVLISMESDDTIFPYDAGNPTFHSAENTHRISVFAEHW